MTNSINGPQNLSGYKPSTDQVTKDNKSVAKSDQPLTEESGLKSESIKVNSSHTDEKTSEVITTDHIAGVDNASKTNNNTVSDFVQSTRKPIAGTSKPWNVQVNNLNSVKAEEAVANEAETTFSYKTDVATGDVHASISNIDDDKTTDQKIRHRTEINGNFTDQESSKLEVKQYTQSNSINEEESLIETDFKLEGLSGSGHLRHTFINKDDVLTHKTAAEVNLEISPEMIQTGGNLIVDANFENTISDPGNTLRNSEGQIKLDTSPQNTSFSFAGKSEAHDFKDGTISRTIGNTSFNRSNNGDKVSFYAANATISHNDADNSAEEPTEEKVNWNVSGAYLRDDGNNKGYVEANIRDEAITGNSDHTGSTNIAADVNILTLRAKAAINHEFKEIVTENDSTTKTETSIGGTAHQSKDFGRSYGLAYGEKTTIVEEATDTEDENTINIRKGLSAHISDQEKVVSASYTYGDNGKSTGVNAGLILTDEEKSASLQLSHANSATGIKVDGALTAARTDFASRYSGKGRLNFENPLKDPKIAKAYSNIGISLSGHLSHSEKVEIISENEDEQTMRLMFSSSDSKSIGAGVNVAIPSGLEVGASTHIGRFHNAIYLTDMSTDEAQAAIQAKESKSHIPDPTKPLDLKEGDLLMMQRRGEMSFSADLGFMNISAKGRFKMLGEFNYTIEKLEGNKARIKVEPQDIKSGTLEGQLFTFSASTMRQYSTAFSQNYEIDLSTEAGIEFYKKAIEGELPKIDFSKLTMGAQVATDFIDSTNEQLPSGVRATHFSNKADKSVKNSGEFTLSFLSRSIAKQVTTSNETIVEKDRVIHKNTLRTATSKMKFLSGTKKTGTFSTIVHLTDEDDQGKAKGEFKEITLGAYYNNGENSGYDYSQTVEEFGEIFGKKWKFEKKKGFGEKTDLEVTITASAEILAQISLENIGNLDNIAKEKGEMSRDVKNLMQGLRSAADPEEKADALKEYVKIAGPKGLGILEEAFPGFKSKTHSNFESYVSAINKAQKTILKFRGREITAGVSKEDIENFRERFSEYSQAKAALRANIAAAKRDPLIEETESGKILTALQQANDFLERMVDFQNLTKEEINSLKNGLRVIAMTDIDFAAITHLENEATDTELKEEEQE